MTWRRLLAGVWGVSLALAAAACGSATSPTTTATAASESLSLSGQWSGTFSYVTGGVTVSEDVTASLLQNGDLATGNWASSGSATGTFSVRTQATTTGNFTISQPNVGSATACAGSSTLSGSASASSLVLNIATVPATAACPWATSMKLTLRR